MRLPNLIKKTEIDGKHYELYYNHHFVGLLESDNVLICNHGCISGEDRIYDYLVRKINELYPISVRKYAIELPGYKGKYYITDKRHMGIVGNEYRNYYLLESHSCDCVAGLIVDDYYHIICDECWNGLDSYLEEEYDAENS